MRRSFPTVSICLSMGLLLSVTGCATRPTTVDEIDCNDAAGDCSSAHQTASKRISGPPRNQRDLTQQPPSLTVAQTLQNAPDVNAALARSSAAASEIDTAAAMRMPQLSFDSSSGYSTSEGNPFTGRAEGRAYSYTLTAKVPLYQGGRDSAALDLAQSQYRASIETSKDVLISTALSLLSAQVQVKRTSECMAIFDRHLRSLRSLRINVQGERQAGAATSVDVGEVDRQLLRLEVERKQSALSLADAQETILRLNSGLVDKSVISTSFVASRLPQILPDLLELAMRNNPRISTRLARMDAANARIDQARAAYNPSIGLALSVGGQRSPGNRYEEVQTSAVARVSVPLYSGGAREATIQGRHEDFRAAALDKDSAVLGVRAAVTTAFNRRLHAQAMLELSRRQLSVARSQIDGVKQERKLGERTVFDEIRSISDAADAELDVARAIYELAVSEFVLAAETGMLDDILGMRTGPAPASVVADYPAVLQKS